MSGIRFAGHEPVPVAGLHARALPGPLTRTAEVNGERIFGPQASDTFWWDTFETPNGPAVPRVTVRDAAGNETFKDCPRTVSNPALSVPITGIADGDTVGGNVTVGFQPLADGRDVRTGASLYIDGKLVAQNGMAPYTYAWDTTTVSNGLHTIRADMHWSDSWEPLASSTIQVRVENAAPSPTGLVAAYGFEETSGTTVADSSGKGSTGTVSGATSVAGGKFGRALSFDGANDMVTAADSSALDLAPGMTLEAWVKPTTVNDWRTVPLKERPGSLAYALYSSADNGRPMTEIAVSGQREARGASALPVGVWSHLAATYDGSAVRLFVNGTQVASAAAGGTLFNSAGALRIGGNSIWGEWFSGLIDDVRVYERALSAAEIQADRDRAVVPGT